MAEPLNFDHIFLFNKKQLYDIFSGSDPDGQELNIDE